MMTSYTVRRDNMIPMNFEGHPTDSITVVLRNEADAKIEKARREARLQGIQEAGSIRLDREQAARADERERIADMLEREMNAPDSKDHAAEWNRVTRDALRYAITCIRNPRPAKPFCVCDEYFERHGKHHPNCGCEPKDAQEPKPMEKFGPHELWQPLESKLNALVDAVNDLVLRLNEISPGNRP